ncbi:unnamed protein product [Diamesa serratosioi]
MPVGGRMGGKAGYSAGYAGQGRSYHDINEEIIWASIGMAVTIGLLITIALCYILYEKCQKRREYYVNV